MRGQRRQRAAGIASRAAILGDPEQTRRLAAFALAEEFELLGHDLLGAARRMGAAPPVRPDEAEHRGTGT